MPEDLPPPAPPTTTPAPPKIVELPRPPQAPRTGELVRPVDPPRIVETTRPPVTTRPPETTPPPVTTRPPETTRPPVIAIPVVESVSSPEVGVPLAPRPRLPVEAERVPGAGSGFGAAELSRAPDNLLVARRGDAQLYTFLPGPASRPARLRLPIKTTTAEAISFLVGYVLPVRTDLSGGLSGWYRLEQDGQPLPASAALEQADAAKPLNVRFVPNRATMADIEVVGATVPLRFVTPVGLAVPIASLVDHLEAWLGLPDARWRLFRDGRALDLHAILADDPCAGLLRLQLRISDEAEGERA